MVTAIDKLTKDGCSAEDKAKVCRSRGGESCAFDGAMIVLQPIADTAHIVHGPIACCGNSWEGRGTKSRVKAYGLGRAQPSRNTPVQNGYMPLHQMGFTTDMAEIDIIYGSEEKLLKAIHRTYQAVQPKAIFVYSTCVSGLTGEDIDAVCKRAEDELDVRVIPVNAPGFVGPKNLGNRIAGEVLLEHVIGTAEPPIMTHYDINLIGEYNIAGDLWLVEPLLAKAGIRILSRLTGDSTFEEITWAHRAKLNVVVCGRALINVAREMERKYQVPYIEASFFGNTEIAKALRMIAEKLRKTEVSGQKSDENSGIQELVTKLVRTEERQLKLQLKSYKHLRGKKAMLYTGGVKSWSFISALRDLGIDVVAIGTKKSTVEDEEKMKMILGPDAPLVEDVTPKNLLKLLKERQADMLIAGGRNQYLAVKEGYPFVDVNQERHTAYAGYQGLVNLAEQISNSLRFYNAKCGVAPHPGPLPRVERGNAKTPHPEGERTKVRGNLKSEILINPLKHSPSIGAAMALQGIDGALPLIHGAQGCTFLGKVLLTRHFREPIALASSKLFVEDVVMGSEEKLLKAVEGFVEKSKPGILGILTSGLSEVKGDDVKAVIRRLAPSGYDCLREPAPGDFECGSARVGCAGCRESGVGKPLRTQIIHVATPDYDGGLEAGYARAVEAVIQIVDFTLHSRYALVGAGVNGLRIAESSQNQPDVIRINLLVGPHLTPADVSELREIVESFGMRPVILPDLSALDGSRQSFSPLAAGGTTLEDVRSMAGSDYTIVFGVSMEPAAKLLSRKSGIEYQVFESAAGIAATDAFMQTLSKISGTPIPRKYERQKQVLIDAMRDAHFYFGGTKICIAVDPDLAVQISHVLDEMSASVDLAVIPALSEAADRIRARDVRISDLFSIEGAFDLLVSNSHGESTAKRLGVPLYEMGFPVYKTFGYTSKVTIGYRGTLMIISEIASLLMKKQTTEREEGPDENRFCNDRRKKRK